MKGLACTFSRTMSSSSSVHGPPFWPGSSGVEFPKGTNRSKRNSSDMIFLRLSTTKDCRVFEYPFKAFNNCASADVLPYLKRRLNRKCADNYLDKSS